MSLVVGAVEIARQAGVVGGSENQDVPIPGGVFDGKRLRKEAREERKERSKEVGRDANFGDCTSTYLSLPAIQNHEPMRPASLEAA